MRRRVEAPTPLAQSPAARGYPRSAKGEYAQWQDGRCFSSSQMEWHSASHHWFASVDSQFGIIELETGEWLADGWIFSERYPDRQAALKAAAEKCIQRVTVAAQPFANGRVYSPLVRIEFANAVIQWAANEAGIPAPLIDAPAPKVEVHEPKSEIAEPAQLDLFGAA